MSYRIVIEPQAKYCFKWWLEEDIIYLNYETWIPVVQTVSKDLPGWTTKTYECQIEGFSNSEKSAEKSARKAIESLKLRLERERQAQKQANINKAHRRYISE